MPRYYFEVKTDTAFYDDKKGEDCLDDQAALKAGQRLARDLAEEAPDFNGSTLTVRNDEGDAVGEFAIRPPTKRLQ